MMRIVSSSELLQILEERRAKLTGVEERVAEIIRRVKEDGEPALRELTKIYDGVEIDDFRVSDAEIKEAKKEFLNPEWRRRLKKIADRIRTFAKKELPKNFKIAEPEGTLERLYVPIEPVGVYVPAGTAPLVSTALMAIVPAQTAGVKRIIAATPPGKDKKANKAVVATCAFLGVSEIYKIGGAQAIAALAFGIGKIPKVALIIGPGNEYVAAAKRLLYGIVNLDCPAGPSEVVVFADQTAPPSFVSAELAGQAEHRYGLAVLITPDKKVAEGAAKFRTDGFIVVSGKEKATDLIEAIAPEHLVVMVSNARGFAAKIKKSGAIFIGNYSPVALGDYLAGPSHILPTGGAAASFSGLSAATFLRSYARISWNKKGLKKWAGDLEELAELEGLPNHKRSVTTRVR
ncbi:MAG: histidinol dehydrogenase [Candidatus Omnitrophica bacterium]|nr:histidinol dehydrogenase [Candidatus Omnitrophota bacterium]